MTDKRSGTISHSRPTHTELGHHFIGALAGQALLLLLSLKWPRLDPDVLWTLLFWTWMLYIDLRRLFASRREALGTSLGMAGVLALFTFVFHLASA